MTKLKEFVVPGIMLACVAAYWTEAWRLSTRALAFPGVLTLIIVIAVTIVTAQALRGHYIESADAPPDRRGGPRLETIARITVIVAPAALVAAWDYLGAVLVYLFKNILYLRLPSGVFGIGP